MEINDIGNVILGVVVTQDIPEGRMVLLTSHNVNYDFGSRTDLPGAKVPTNTTEAAKAKYLVTWEQSNVTPPFYKPEASFPFALRYGFEQPSNAPFSSTVYVTNPSVEEGLTIPSGSTALAFGDGIFTVPSGAYIYSASLTAPGATLAVADTSTDGASNAGKLKYGTSNVVAEVVRFDSQTGRLTFRIL